RQPVVAAAAVQPLRDPAIVLALGLEQVQRRRDEALDLLAAEWDLLALDRDVELDVDTPQRVARSLRILVLDRSRLRDDLAGVALVPEQADSGDRNAQIAGRLHVIARQDPQA